MTQSIPQPGQFPPPAAPAPHAPQHAAPAPEARPSIGSLDCSGRTGKAQAHYHHIVGGIPSTRLGGIGKGDLGQSQGGRSRCEGNGCSKSPARNQGHSVPFLAVYL